MPTLTESSGRGCLPVELTTFIGRERELAELRRLLGSTRMLTLTGGGGSGKTRLAAELVGLAAGDLGVDAAWIELAPLDDAAHLAQHVATALGITDEIRSGDYSLLARLLGARRLLLVMDNCEHLVDGCAALVDVLLKTAPDIRVLATSREALGIKGERAWLVPALPLADAVELFVERARDFAGGFELTDRNRATVEEICTRLDGIPLAIELAAARIRVLSPEQLRDRLNDAFRLLKSPARTPIPRHRTLAAAIDWSYNLLTEPEKLLFQRIAVFQGGFTLDALEYVAGESTGGQGDVLDVLARLVDRSLVQVREQGNGARYSLLETVRQYARQKLEDSGEAADARRQHARYVYQLAIEAEPHLIKPERPRWVERLLPDLENIREALNFTRDVDAALHVKLTGSLWWFWYSTRHWTEAAGILERALALPEAAAPTRERAKLLFALGALNSLQAKQQEARAYLEEAIRIAQQCDEQLLAYCQNYLAMTYAAESSKEGVALSTQAAAWFEKHDDPYGQRMSYLMLGTMAGNTGDLAEGERWSRMGLEIARDFGQPRELSIAYHMVAWILAERGDLAGALTYVLESLRASRQDPSFFSISNALDLLGEITGQQGDPLRAARIFGAAEGVRAVIGSRRFPYVEKRQAVKIAAFRAAAGDAAFDQAWAEGSKLPADAILADVLAGQQPSAVEPVPAPTAGGATAKLRVRAMGRFEVVVEDRTLPNELWAYGKPKELLVYLALHPAGRPRDQIARDLWPSATPSQLKNSFHVTLHHLRKALGHPEWIVVEEQRYRLARALEYETDFGGFERRAREALRDQRKAGLQEALELYRGDLLEGEVPGDWVEEHLTGLRRLYLELALTLGAALEQNGQFETAIRLYQQLIARDDLQEEPHRRLIAHWARSGERPRALKHFERLAATLRTTLDAEPELETLNLYRRILTNDAV